MVSLLTDNTGIACESMISLCHTRRCLSISPVAVLRLVDREPMSNIFIVALNDECSIVEVVIYYLTVCPTAVLIEQSKRGIPMEERHSRFDAVLDKLRNHIVVMCDSCLVNWTLPEREDSWPTDAGAEGGDT